MKRATVATILALLFATAPILAAGAPAQEGDIPSISTVPEAAVQPPYCSPVEHVGVLGYLVDQAWMAYRRVERSSPARKGWCACARRCEPIDRLAARYERAAFQAYKLSRDPSIPANQRQQYGKQATRLFGQRNRTVADFRSCVDKARPPLSQPIPALASMAEPIPAGCKVDIKLTVRQEWELWCADYMDRFKSVSGDFITEFKPVKFAEMTFITRVAKNGARQIYNIQITKVLKGNQWVPTMTPTEAAKYRDALLALDLKDIPTGAVKPHYDFKGKLTTFIKVDEPITCPEG